MLIFFIGFVRRVLEYYPQLIPRINDLSLLIIV
jgi:hypothetical protein